jgi:hypothetical protein
MKETFLDAYTTCALWSSNDESNESGGEPLDKNYSRKNLSAEALQVMVEDCHVFQRMARVLLSQTPDDYGVERAGHDFWLTRNHHGAGFWDRDLGEVGEKLTELAHLFGEQNLVVAGRGIEIL